MTTRSFQEYTTPKGNAAFYSIREGTSDGALVTSVVGCDEYHMADLPPLTGWAIDLGSHVGSAAIALALDNPGLRVIAIEPVPENVECIREAVKRNGLDDRVVVIHAAGSSPGRARAGLNYDYTHVDGVDDEHIRQNRYVGGVFREPSGLPGPASTYRTISVPAVSLRSLAEKYGTFRFAKTDCEGGEWDFFSDGAEFVDEIVGEFHDRPWPAISDLLAATHKTTFLGGSGGIGQFHAVRH